MKYLLTEIRFEILKYWDSCVGVGYPPHVTVANHRQNSDQKTGEHYLVSTVVL